MTRLPGLLVARLGPPPSLRAWLSPCGPSPALAGREAAVPRIWATVYLGVGGEWVLGLGVGRAVRCFTGPNAKSAHHQPSSTPPSSYHLPNPYPLPIPIRNHHGTDPRERHGSSLLPPACWPSGARPGLKLNYPEGGGLHQRRHPRGAPVTAAPWPT